MPIPNDPIILMSYLNTQLRDHYSSLEDLCKSMDLGYVYHQERNQFVTA